MTELRLARAKLAKNLGDGSGLNPTAQQLVQFSRPCGQIDHVRPLRVDVRGRGEAHGNQLVGVAEQLVRFALRNTLDRHQLFLGRKGHRLDGKETSLLQGLDVCR